MPRLILIMILLLVSAPAKSVEYDIDVDLYCKPTPQFKLYFVPTRDEIVNNNNLRKIPTDAWFSSGRHIKFLGKVIDSNCVPIQGAIVEIWQNDSKGNVYRSEQEEHFNGSGKTVTNNLGEFVFLTVMPKTKHAEVAPSINVRVRHENFGEILTKVYFPYHPKNVKDREFLEVLDKDIIMATEYIGDDEVPDKIFIHDFVFLKMSEEDHY